MTKQEAKDLNDSCNWYLKNWEYSTSDEYNTINTLEELFRIVEKLTKDIWDD